MEDRRLDVLPMAALCAPCHYNEQNCRLGGRCLDAQRHR
jgi:hypothetical protein